MKPEYLIIHHSLTKDGRAVSWNAIRQYHKSLGWSEIGYHFGIELIGEEYEILTGRQMTEKGAHCKNEGMNDKSLGICVVGNFDIVAPPARAMRKLAMLCWSLMATFNIKQDHIKMHRDFAGYKSCPGRLFPWNNFIETFQFFQ